MRLEWDPGKDRINRKKHQGLDFAAAALVFNDPHMLLRKDRVVEGEQRWHAIAAVRNAGLLVVHVYRKENDNEEETVRIISAREAGEREPRIYIQQTLE